MSSTQVDTAIGHISETLGVLVIDALDHSKEDLNSIAHLQSITQDANHQEVRLVASHSVDCCD
jgi:hypothetical protein